MKVNGPKNAVSKLMNLDDTSPKVNGPPVYFTLKKNRRLKFSQLKFSDFSQCCFGIKRALNLNFQHMYSSVITNSLHLVLKLREFRIW